MALINLNVKNAVELIEQLMPIFCVPAYQECMNRVKYATHVQIIV